MGGSYECWNFWFSFMLMLFLFNMLIVWGDRASIEEEVEDIGQSGQ